MSSHGRVPSAGAEPNTADTGKILMSGFWVLVLIAVSLGLVSLDFKLLAFTQSDRVPGDTVDESTIPERVLSWAHPSMELPIVRAQQNQNITSYGWVDQSKGVVRIPIDQAMALVARGNATTQPAGGAK